MNFDALFHANFKLLDDAVTDWSTLVKNLEQLKKDAEDELHQAANKANWAGLNHQVTKEFIGKTAGEFADAHTQANTIHRILSDTLGELRDYHQQLTTAVENGRKKSLTVFPSGDGFTVTSSIPPQARTGNEPDNTADITALRDEILKILDKATESDSSASTVLKAIADQSKMGFSDANYKDRNAAAKAIADAEAMARILKKDPHDVTNTELATLNSALAMYKNDPLFSEKFATEVGPRKLLTFYAGIADPFQATYDPKRGEQAKQLQKNLGITIGQATLSDSDKMASWKRNMVAIGQDQLGIDDASNPTAFAVMSNLMRFGDYDDQFLNDYGGKLLAFDKQVNGEGINLWVNNANQGDLNYWGYKNDRGRDPVTGFLEALGHNPGASTEFFAQPDGKGELVDKDSEVNEHLKYLTKERVWVSDTTLEGDDDYIAGRKSLGHALEAATTGYPYDVSADAVKIGGEQRTAATAAVMEQVAYLYGSEDGPKMLHDQPEMAESMGKMAGAYIDDIDYALSGLGDSARDAGDFPAAYGGQRAEFGNRGAINFLSVLGQNETSHGIVASAQHLYTASLLDANPPTNATNYDHGVDALSMEAEARGILDHARVQQAAADYGAESEAANKSLGRSADWGKLIVGTAVGVGVAALPIPGSTAAGVAIAPIAADFGGQVVNTFIGHEIDKAVDGAGQKPEEKAQLTSQEFYDKGVNDLGMSYESYFSKYQEAGGKADSQQVTQELKTLYAATGSAEDDFRGRSPYKD
ncbi:DUF6571 family protein [Streptomyces sp. TRM70350]|uniref:DUF6571 family protein n=1 Tax=Streptomyces sp. TRM70350 TaxID=2856165 RepID=UPI001C43B8DF|nr:DUF6571 family protein [Streptomyces sp. TRM70350]MBV7698094.1 hypothetical protein [Streptomyces sp. TRM70350]